ncbi:MAG: hypothetical protein GF400_03150 [Candidatus Eisenbacteria bacterium]|nr:hypothetical protein [Candidatus Eisenbacteria bacterium]
MPKTVALVEAKEGTGRVAECQVKRGDEVVWDAGGTHITVWFPQRGVFPKSGIDIRSGKGSLTVKEDAPEGTYHYAIYCHDTKRFLEGNSHPVMIVKGP